YLLLLSFFFFTDTATTEIYTLSLHDALPISMSAYSVKRIDEMETAYGGGMRLARAALGVSSFGMQVEEFPPNFDQYPEHSHSERSEEHTSELQSPCNLVCRLLLEKKKKYSTT